MTLSPSISTAVAGLPQASTALSRLFVSADELRSTRTILSALATDQEVASLFLKLARVSLPGRRFTNVGEAVPLLGETIGMRLALLASCVLWLKNILGNEPASGPLLRHAIATAAAAEPLGRESGVVDPLHAFSLGLLHHIGDAARISPRCRFGTEEGEYDFWELGADLLRSAGAPDNISMAVNDYGNFMRDRCMETSFEVRILGAADYTVTTFGYAAPTVGAQPAVDARIMDAVAGLLDSRKRICKSIEAVMGTALGDGAREILPRTEEDTRVLPMSPVVMPEVLEGVSTRDLGPLPVLFSRISSGQDSESITVAGTAGLVEEMGMIRAYFLHLEEDGCLRGGVLSSRGNVPLPLHELTLHQDQRPRALNMALKTGRPILHESLIDGLDVLWSDLRAPMFFVPVVVGKTEFGILGVEVADPSAVLPDLLAAVAAHMGLALKGADLLRQSEEARIDELTGLYNRRGILDILDSQLEHSDSTGGELAIALIDCDHLKKVNDNFGHLMGDEFVRRISEVTRQSLRVGDELGRYGGDEFLAVLPDATLRETQLAVERARANVERAGLESEDGLLLSVSIGACVRGESGASRERLLKLSDYALYRAKERGRNAVDVMNADAPPDVAL